MKKCTCGNETFNATVSTTEKVKVVSANGIPEIVNGTQGEQHTTFVGVFTCTLCNEVYNDITEPDEGDCLTLRCSCGNTRFTARQRCYHDVIVNSSNVFERDFSISDAERPCGPYCCTRCGEEYDYLSKLKSAQESMKLTAAEEREYELFFKIENKDSERYGAIGYMRADFGKNGKEFHHEWFDITKHMVTAEFKAEYDKIIEYLRHGMEHPIFSNRQDLEVFCLQHDSQRLADHGVGFKIQTDDYSYYVRCRPTPKDYDIYVFAYKNDYLIPELAGQHGLPFKCFSLLKSNGELIYIFLGENGYHQSDQSTQSAEENRRIADRNNAILGVTRAQEEALLSASLFGYGVPAAKPWHYNADGTPRTIINEEE